MKYLAIILAFPFLSVTDCSQKKTEAGSIPACIQKIIDDAGKDNPPNTPQKVDEYLYNGKKVFLVTAHCCDQYNTLYDENCKEICSPTGGFSGKGDGKCPDFSEKATHVRVAWENKQK